MSPYQPPEQQEPNSSNDRYDFFMSDTNSPSQIKSFGLKPNGQPSKVFFGIIAAAALVIIIIIFAILSNGGKASPGLVKITQQQTELARVAELNQDDLNDESVKAFAINTRLSMLSANADFLSFLGSSGVGISAEKQALGQNPTTDTQLENAKINGNLDSTLKQTLTTQITEYQVTLRSVFQNASSAQLRQQLVVLKDQADLLLSQAEQK